MSLLGLDIGTTGCKAVAFDLDGRSLASAYREYPLYHPQPGWAELDPAEVWACVEQVLAEVAAQTASDPVRAMGVSSQGEAGVPIDAAGNDLCRSPVSFDARAVGHCELLERSIGRRRLFEITGQPPAGAFTVPKLMWLKQAEPEVFGRMKRFLCFEDYALYRLGGVFATDWSLAGRTLAFDVREKVYSAQVCAAAGIDPEIFSEAHPTGTAVGSIRPEVAGRLGLPAGVVLATGGHDQPAGALGGGVVAAGIALDSTGTVECITASMDEPVFSDAMLESSFCCYSHTATPLYATLAYNFTGGSLWKWVRDTLGEAELSDARRRGVDVYDVLTERAADEPTSLFVLPHFTTTGTPHFDDRSKGAVLGLTLSTGRGELLRAFLEGITYEMKLNLELLESAGVSVERLRAIGGGAKSGFWLQLKADMWDRPVEAMDVSEAPCLGVALAAGAALGEYPSPADAARNLVQSVKTYEPDVKRAAYYDERFEIYREIYPTIRELSHRM